MSAGDLSPREQDVGRALTRGLTNKQIALELGISPATVKNHLNSVYVKLGVNTRSGAVAQLVSSGSGEAGEPA